MALALCLGKPADVYLIDEPSAYLDSEQRLMAARVIKRWVHMVGKELKLAVVLQWDHITLSSFLFPPHFSFILHAKKTAFVVEHDFIMATYLADRVIVFDGIPSKNTLANR